MRAAAIALFLALAVVVSDSALARKGGGGHVSGGSVKFSGGHVSGGKVHGGHVVQGRHFNGHHHHGHYHKSFGHHHHGHHHSTTFVGVGFAYPWPWYWHYPPLYYYPGYYYPQPVTYVEQGAAPAPAEPAGWWYYCETSRTYYPYVKECPNGWQRVPALPPAPN